MVDGKEYVIRAKAVVLATGGFAGSGEMEEKYLENTYYPLKGEWKLFGQHQDDGKMLEAAIQNGAATYNISVAPMVHVGGVDGFLPGFETVPVEGQIGTATGRPAVWSAPVRRPRVHAADRDGRRSRFPPKPFLQKKYWEAVCHFSGWNFQI